MSISRPHSSEEEKSYEQCLCCRAMKSKNSSFPQILCSIGEWYAVTLTQHRSCLGTCLWCPKRSRKLLSNLFIAERNLQMRLSFYSSPNPVLTEDYWICSKKALKLKQSVPPPKTPDPVDGRRHIELQVCTAVVCYLLVCVHSCPVLHDMLQNAIWHALMQPLACVESTLLAARLPVVN